MLKISSEIPLASALPVRYQGIAYDGCHFYLSKQGEAQIVRLDECYQVAQCYTVRRCYSCLCYDPVRCCFWACGDQYSSVLFKLDRDFREIDRFLIRDTGACCCNDVGVICNISYVCWKDALLLSTTSGLIWVWVAKDCEPVIERLGDWIDHPLAQREEGRACVCGTDTAEPRIRLFLENGNIEEKHLESECFCIDGAVFGCCVDCPHKCCLYVLARKHGCYPYLLICAVDRHFCCGCCPPKPPCPPWPPCPKPDPRACEDLLESVALVEAALSHILNAEGEKLQKAIADSEDLEVLFKMNETVRKTLIEATHLEQVLYHKLELAHELCDSCKHENGERDAKISQHS